MTRMKIAGALALALATAACGGSGGPDGPIDDNAGMMISNETVMSDSLGSEAANGAAPAAAENASE